MDKTFNTIGKDKGEGHCYYCPGGGGYHQKRRYFNGSS